MSKQKHTPAPWICSKNFTVKTTNKQIIAEVYAVKISNDTGEIEANMSLIAAAPDLLRAVILFLGESEEEDIRFAFEQDKIDFARAAVAKAKGRKC